MVMMMSKDARWWRVSVTDRESQRVLREEAGRSEACWLDVEDAMRRMSQEIRARVHEEARSAPRILIFEVQVSIQRVV